jgi:hypothetical protein
MALTTSNTATPLTTDEYERLWRRLVLFVDLYKHHFELFVKGFVVYLAIIAGASGIAFGGKVSTRTQQSLLVLVGLTSLCACIAWIVSLVWVARFATLFHELCDRLDVPRLPAFGVKAIVTGAVVLTGIITIMTATLLSGVLQ